MQLRFLFIGLMILSIVNGQRSSNILDQKTFDVEIQDQTTDPIIVKFNKIEASTTTKYATSIDSKNVVLNSVVSADVGDLLILFSPVAARFSKAIIMSISNDTITLDTPLDFSYPPGSYVDISTTNMAVNGSVTPQIFGIRGVSDSPIGLSLDITRLIFTCITDDPVDLSKFADIAGGITNGIVLRKVDGRYFNVFNVKTNAELAGLMYDFTILSSTNPVQGQNGFTGRLTFAGQGKIGVVIRLMPGEDLQIVIQDNLSSIQTLEITAEGHIVKY